MRKGDLVRLNPLVCFTEEFGGGLRFPLSSYGQARDGIVPGTRPATQAEQDAWRQRLRENVSAGTTEWHDSAGESKLPPQSVTIPLYRERTYIVLRARVRVRLGWGNPAPGMTKLLCTHTGEEVYIKRNLLEKVE